MGKLVRFVSFGVVLFGVLVLAVLVTHSTAQAKGYSSSYPQNYQHMGYSHANKSAYSTSSMRYDCNSYSRCSNNRVYYTMPLNYPQKNMCEFNNENYQSYPVMYMNSCFPRYSYQSQYGNMSYSTGQYAVYNVAYPCNCLTSYPTAYNYVSNNSYSSSWNRY